ADQTFFMEQLARASLGRGRYDLSVRTSGAAAAAPRLSPERIRALHRSLLELRDELAPGSELPFTAVLGLPDIVEPVVVDTDSLQAALSAAFATASTRLEEMRREEGVALTQELSGRLESARR